MMGTLRRVLPRAAAALLWLVADCADLPAQVPAFSVQLPAAEQLFQQGRVGEAQQAFQALAEAYGEEPQPHWYLGLIAYQQNRYMEARNHFRALVERNEDGGAGWAMLGLAEFRLKEYEEALPHLELGRYLGIANNEDLAHSAALHQAFLCNRIQRFDVALGALSELAVQGRKTPAIVAAFGIAALNRPWLLEDVPRTEQAVVMEAGETAWLLGARRQQEAAERAEGLIRKYPGQPGLHFILGTTLVRADWKRAEAALRQELSENPRHYFALVTLASELTDRGQSVEAIPFAKRAIQLQPQSHVARGLYGKALLNAERIPEAIAQLEEAVRIAPTNANVRYSLAIAYGRAGRKEDAAREREIFAQLQGKRASAAAAASGQEQR